MKPGMETQVQFDSRKRVKKGKRASSTSAGTNSASFQGGKESIQAFHRVSGVLFQGSKAIKEPLWSPSFKAYRLILPANPQLQAYFPLYGEPRCCLKSHLPNLADLGSILIVRLNQKNSNPTPFKAHTSSRSRDIFHSQAFKV